MVGETTVDATFFTDYARIMLTKIIIAYYAGSSARIIAAPLAGH